MIENINYVSNYIDKNYFNVDELKDLNYKSLLCRKIASAIPNVDLRSGQYDFLINGHIDREMKSKKSVSYEKFINVKNYIYLVINYYKTIKNIEINDFDKLLLRIVKKIISKYKYEDIMNGLYDEEIKRSIFIQEKPENDEQITRKIVNDYIKENSTFIEEDIDETLKIAKSLIDSGYSSDRVKKGECDSLMESYIVKEAIKKNSIKSRNSTINKIPLIKKNNSKVLRTKALTMAIITSIFVGICFANANNIEKPSIEDTLMEISTTFDEYEYPRIDGEGSNEFVDTSHHIIYKYSDYAQYGEEFGQLCLLKGFKSVDSDPYYAMDVVMNLAVEAAKYSENLETISKDVSDCSCYPQYVLNKLIKAKISSVFNGNIVRAVHNYDKQTNNYKQYYPYSTLNKEDQKALQKMMEIYEKYCEDLNVELAKKINETKEITK